MVSRRYTLDEVKRRIIEELKNSGAGLSGVELADKTGINRMTVTKYLDVLHAVGLVGKKKIGSVNVWFIEPGAADLEFPVSYVQAQQKLIAAVFAGNEKQAQRLMTGILTSNVEPVKALTDVIMPAVNTIGELYSVGRLSRSERSYFLNLLGELTDLVKLNAQSRPSSLRNAHAIIVAGSADRGLAAKCAAGALALEGWDTKYLGSVEHEIDPFFDIDFQRFVSKEWADKSGSLVIGIFTSGEGSLRFLCSASRALKGRLKGELRIGIQTTPELLAIGEENGDFAGKDLESFLNWCARQQAR